jgi:hypothetical protein
MGRVGVLEKTETDDDTKTNELTVETRSEYNQLADLFSSSGDDSPPLKDDRIILVKVDGTGKYAAVGVLSISQGAKPGERIIYARDADANIVSRISMLNDGSVALESDEKIAIKTKKDFSIESQKHEIKASEAKITGGTLEVAGSTSPTGSGPFCGIAVCPFTGAPHVGSKVSGT